MNKEEFIEEVLKKEEENMKLDKSKQWIIREIIKLIDEGWDETYDSKKSKD